MRCTYDVPLVYREDLVTITGFGCGDDSVTAGNGANVSVDDSCIWSKLGMLGNGGRGSNAGADAVDRLLIRETTEPTEGILGNVAPALTDVGEVCLPLPMPELLMVRVEPGKEGN